MGLEWILVSLAIAGLVLAYLFFAKTKDPLLGSTGTNPYSANPQNRRKEMTNTPSSVQSSGKKGASIGTPGTNGNRDDPNVIEVFDYNGTKILHENGLWSVNDGGVVQVYADWSKIPPRYQKMVKELDSRSIQNEKQSGYFLEILNGFYYVSMPGGKKKKYNTFTDIPEDIRKFLGK